MPLWVQRLVLGLGIIASVGVITGLGVVLSRTRAEYARISQLELQTRQRLQDVELRLAEQEAILDRLRNDPAYVETVIRRRLGYAKPGEFIFRFED